MYMPYLTKDEIERKKKKKRGSKTETRKGTVGEEGEVKKKYTDHQSRRSRQWEEEVRE